MPIDVALLRTRQIITKRSKTEVISAKRMLLNFASNDYLQLATHPKVIEATQNALTQFGLGSSSSPQICGYFDSHERLENALSLFLKREKTILFSSGYLANLAMLTTFADRNSVIIADKLCHASLIDGARLSRARLLRFPHQNMSAANCMAEKYSTQKKLFVTESVFGMQGNITSLEMFVKLSKKYQGFLCVDDAHGVGIFNTASHANIDCLITPFGKTLGAMGAAISGNFDTIQTLLQNARTYRYSTAIPPSLCAGVLAALKLMQKEPWRKEKLLRLISFFQKLAHELQLPFMESQTAIQCLCIKDNRTALQIQQFLFEKNIWIACIRPPTVPKNKARLRISLTALHTESDIILLLTQLKRAYELFKKN